MTSLTRKEPYTMPKTYHTKATQEIEQYLSLHTNAGAGCADGKKASDSEAPTVTGAYGEPDDFVGGSDQKVKSSVVCNQQAGIRRRFKNTCFCSIP